MSGLVVISVCVTVVLSVLGIAAIFANAWVKASDLTRLDEKVDKVQGEIDKLWDKFSTVTVLETKIEAIENGIREIKDLLKQR